VFIIEADSADKAQRISALHPSATLGEEGGWAVELTPRTLTWPNEWPAGISATAFGLKLPRAAHQGSPVPTDPPAITNHAA
jgi:hypothetical protein